MVEDESKRHKTPHVVDLHVGGRVRTLRKVVRLNQAELGEAVGLTFQQIQKYERGANRISVSKAYELCAVLQCSIADLFAGLPEPSRDIDPRFIQAANDASAILVSSPDAREITRGYARLTPRSQRALKDLIAALVDGHEG